MKKSKKTDLSFFISAIKLLVLVIIFFESKKVWPNENDFSPSALDTAQEAVVKSQEVRKEISKNPKRSLATISKEDQKWEEEFERLEKDESDRDWFSEVDKVIQN